jgi:hypothetical protein
LASAELSESELAENNKAMEELLEKLRAVPEFNYLRRCRTGDAGNLDVNTYKISMPQDLTEEVKENNFEQESYTSTEICYNEKAYEQLIDVTLKTNNMLAALRNNISDEKYTSISDDKQV